VGALVTDHFVVLNDSTVNNVQEDRKYLPMANIIFHCESPKRAARARRYPSSAGAWIHGGLFGRGSMGQVAAHCKVAQHGQQHSASLFSLTLSGWDFHIQFTLETRPHWGESETNKAKQTDHIPGPGLIKPAQFT